MFPKERAEETPPQNLNSTPHWNWYPYDPFRFFVPQVVVFLMYTPFLLTFLPFSLHSFTGAFYLHETRECSHSKFLARERSIQRKGQFQPPHVDSTNSQQGVILAFSKESKKRPMNARSILNVRKIYQRKSLCWHVPWIIYALHCSLRQRRQTMNATKLIGSYHTQ